MYLYVSPEKSKPSPSEVYVEQQRFWESQPLCLTHETRLHPFVMYIYSIMLAKTVHKLYIVVMG